MIDDFQPVPPAKAIPIAELRDEERKQLEEAGLTLANHTHVASNLMSRLRTSTMSADMVNQLALEEQQEEQDLEGVHPDIAEALREELLQGADYSNEAVDAATKRVDEDDFDPPKTKSKTTPDPEEAQNFALDEINKFTEYKKIVRLESEHRLAKYSAKIDEDLISDILDEVVTGNPFVRTFSFFGGRLTMQVRTLSSTDSTALADHLAQYINEKRPTMEEFNLYRHYVRSALQLLAVTAKNKLLYSVKSERSVADSLDAVYGPKGCCNSDITRRLLQESVREMNGLLSAVIHQCGEEVFTVPSYEDVG